MDITTEIWREDVARHAALTEKLGLRR